MEAPPNSPATYMSPNLKVKRVRPWVYYWDDSKAIYIPMTPQLNDTRFNDYWDPDMFDIAVDLADAKKKLNFGRKGARPMKRPRE